MGLGLMSRTYNTAPEYIQAHKMPSVMHRTVHHHELLGEPVMRYETVLDEKGEIVYEEKQSTYQVTVAIVKSTDPVLKDFPKEYLVEDYGHGYWKISKVIQKTVSFPVKKLIVVGYYSDFCSGVEKPLSPSQQELLGLYQPCYIYTNKRFWRGRKNSVNRNIRNIAEKKNRKYNNSVLNSVSKYYAKGYNIDDNFDLDSKIKKREQALFW
jgi:hypothetical protein